MYTHETTTHTCMNTFVMNKREEKECVALMDINSPFWL